MCCNLKFLRLWVIHIFLPHLTSRLAHVAASRCLLTVIQLLQKCIGTRHGCQEWDEIRWSFSGSERCFGWLSVSEIWMSVNLWTSKTPTGEVLFFCEQLTHHFDVICIYPAMYVLMITKILHQLRPGRQYTLLFSFRVLYMPDPRCYKLSAKMECRCVIYYNTDFAWIFVAQALAIAFV